MHVMVPVWRTVCGSWFISFTMWHLGNSFTCPMPSVYIDSGDPIRDPHSCEAGAMLTKYLPSSWSKIEWRLVPTHSGNHRRLYHVPFTSQETEVGGCKDMSLLKNTHKEKRAEQTLKTRSWCMCDTKPGAFVPPWFQLLGTSVLHWYCQLTTVMSLFGKIHPACPKFPVRWPNLLKDSGKKPRKNPLWYFPSMGNNEKQSDASLEISELSHGMT